MNVSPFKGCVGGLLFPPRKFVFDLHKNWNRNHLNQEFIISKNVFSYEYKFLDNGDFVFMCYMNYKLRMIFDQEILNKSNGMIFGIEINLIHAYQTTI